MARALFRPRATRDEDPESTLEALRAIGAPDSAIEAAEARIRASAERATIEVHDDNAATVQLFDALLSQWRFAGMQGIRVGLDYTAIEPTARMLDVELGPMRFQELRLMESVARQEIALQASKQNGRNAASGSSSKGSRRGAHKGRRR